MFNKSITFLILSIIFSSWSDPSQDLVRQPHTRFCLKSNVFVLTDYWDWMHAINICNPTKRGTSVLELWLDAFGFFCAVIMIKQCFMSIITGNEHAIRISHIGLRYACHIWIISNFVHYINLVSFRGCRSELYVCEVWMVSWSLGSIDDGVFLFFGSGIKRQRNLERTTTSTGQCSLNRVLGSKTNWDLGNNCFTLWDLSLVLKGQDKYCDGLWVHLLCCTFGLRFIY